MNTTFMWRVMNTIPASDMERITRLYTDEIYEWQHSPMVGELHEWLGMTRLEYNVVTAHPEAMRVVINSRRWQNYQMIYEDVGMETRTDNSVASQLVGGNNARLSRKND